MQLRHKLLRVSWSRLQYRLLHSRFIIDEILNKPEDARRNSVARNCEAAMERVIELGQEYRASSGMRIASVPAELSSLISKLPNWTYNGVLDRSKPKLLTDMPVTDGKPSRRLTENAKGQGLILQDQDYTSFCGDRSYFLAGDFARLESALIKFSLDLLLHRHGFQLVSVPDILTPQEIEVCGMQSSGERSQIYHIEIGTKRKLCLSGTAEMALVNLFRKKQIPRAELPLKLCAVSRCYRAEVSTPKEEKGVYRVHQFTKLEMFGLTEGQLDHSQRLQGQLVDIVRDLYQALGLHIRTIDMPPHELGNPAYRKIDTEAWMSGHGFFGELSSTSDCTSYQAIRADITCAEDGRPVHTVNGTACAIPRMLIAIGETHSKPNGIIRIPEVLQPFMGADEIHPEPSLLRRKHLSYYYFENLFCDRCSNDSIPHTDTHQSAYPSSKQLS